MNTNKGWGYGHHIPFSLLLLSVVYQVHQHGFMNIDLVSPKTADYWCDTIRRLKTEFPNTPTIASIAAAYNKDVRTLRPREAGPLALYSV